MRFLRLLILSYSLFTHFLSLLILSCFFMCFLPSWLCMVSTCITFAKSEFIFIPLHEDIMSFLPYIGLGLPNPFAFFSLHLFTTLGWAYWPFCFLFSLIFSPHWVRPTDPFTFFFFFSLHLLCCASLIGLIPILLIKKGLLLLIFILNTTLLPKGTHEPTFGLYFSFSKYSSFLGHHLDLICALSSLWAFRI